MSPLRRPATSGGSISVGDLVQVVRKAGYCECWLGRIFVVEALERSPDGQIICDTCGTTKPTELDAQKPGGGWNPVVMLQRIPPLSELEGVKTEETIHA